MPQPPDSYRPLSALRVWEDNYNHNDVAAIALSIRRFGFNAALRVWREGVVAAGNHTLKALNLIHEEGARPDLDRAFPPENVFIAEDGTWHVLCVDVAHLDELEFKAFAIADNQLARNAVTDDDLLNEYLREIAAYDPLAARATGIDDGSLERLLAQLVTEDAQPNADPGAQVDRAAELQQKWQTAPGQLWLIPSKTHPGGTHRLLCGNSRLAADVQRVMAGQRAQLFATDPPYLVDYDGTNHPHKWNENDKNKDWSAHYTDWDSSEQGVALYEDFVREAVAHAIAEDAAWYCWHASRNQAMLEQVWTQHGAFVHQQIVWVKDRAVLTRSWYMWQHEPCFFGWVKGSKPPRLAEDYPPTVWQHPTIAPGTATDHPTSKPVELFARPMQQHTRRGDVCYEPFAGSGSQFVAGEQLGRLVYGIELNPAFVAVILERLSGIGLVPVLDEPPPE